MIKHNTNLPSSHLILRAENFKLVFLTIFSFKCNVHKRGVVFQTKLLTMNLNNIHILFKGLLTDWRILQKKRQNLI